MPLLALLMVLSLVGAHAHSHGHSHGHGHSQSHGHGHSHSHGHGHAGHPRSHRGHAHQHHEHEQHDGHSHSHSHAHAHGHVDAGGHADESPLDSHAHGHSHPHVHQPVHPTGAAYGLVPDADLTVDHVVDHETGTLAPPESAGSCSTKISLCRSSSAGLSDERAPTVAADGRRCTANCHIDLSRSQDVKLGSACRIELRSSADGELAPEPVVLASGQEGGGRAHEDVADQTLSGASSV
eukprot:TRINITY_DN3312_c0_g1_i1.p1 TRINITY_DN3312_c0_g1~~TRINITY_DN3312_c0_g1_i1.p1  ORF type:complete len:238 (+),score=27.20 TRINITY_DN3312_c0_g1_i1:746-1459(+)